MMLQAESLYQKNVHEVITALCNHILVGLFLTLFPNSLVLVDYSSMYTVSDIPTVVRRVQ